MSTFQLIRTAGCWLGRFNAMASNCEVLIETEAEAEAQGILQLVADEVWRIEQKFSRYRSDNVVYQINHAQGLPQTVDEESANLLDFADHCYTLSEGRFDVTSGVLRELWIFDGNGHVPRPDQIEAILPRIGWQRVSWHRPRLILLPGMEIDFGGIGKEYAVDRAIQLVRDQCDRSVLVNLGGDLAVTRPRKSGDAWQVGVEDPDHAGQARLQLALQEGAIATSGSSRRFILRDGVRYGHILDPRTGEPVVGGPRSITVAAPNCSEAGLLATVAMLHGASASAFLESQQVRYWSIT